MERSNVSGRRESPVLNSRTFQTFTGATYEQAMTVRGAVNKTAILLIIVVISAALGWSFSAHDARWGGFSPWLIPVSVIAFIVGLITSVNKQVAPL